MNDNKEKLETINNELEYVNYKSKQIQNINNGICSLDNNINKCISLIEETVSGSDVTRIVKKMYEENNNINRINNENIIDENNFLTTRINMLKEQATSLEKEIRKENEE